MSDRCLEIKDGSALSAKYDGEVLTFKIPNVLIVFGNREQDRKEFSKDMWTILEISQDLTRLTDVTKYANI